jgi:hypothetical protein
VCVANSNALNVCSPGLISAAKFVALATQQLVSASSKLADGQLKDADLIAASKAVAAATAQLVAASTVKADTFSKPQENLVKVTPPWPVGPARTTTR